MQKMGQSLKLDWVPAISKEFRDVMIVVDDASRRNFKLYDLFNQL